MRKKNDHLWIEMKFYHFLTYFDVSYRVYNTYPYSSYPHIFIFIMNKFDDELKENYTNR